MRTALSFLAGMLLATYIGYAMAQAPLAFSSPSSAMPAGVIILTLAACPPGFTESAALAGAIGLGTTYAAHNAGAIMGRMTLANASSKGQPVINTIFCIKQ